VGLVRERFFASAAPSPTVDQVAEATDAVSSALRAKGDDIANYKLRMGKRVRPLGKEGGSRRVLQVALLGGSTRHFYLVDVATHEIVVHAEVDSILDETKFDDYGELVHLLGVR
jgi:hypothetical protein